MCEHSYQGRGASTVHFQHISVKLIPKVKSPGRELVHVYLFQQFSMMCECLFCVCRKKMKRGPPKGDPAMQPSVPIYKEGGQYVKQGEMTAGGARLSQMGPAMPPGAGQAPLRDNEYAYVREMWPMALPPNASLVSHQPYGTGTAQQPTNYGTSPRPGGPTPSFTYGTSPGKVSPITPESTPSGSISPTGPEHHIYESPKTIRRELEILAHGPHYFELDPNILSNKQKQQQQGHSSEQGSYGGESPRTPDDHNSENRRILGNFSRD